MRLTILSISTTHAFCFKEKKCMFKDKVCTFEKVPKEIFIEDALPHFLVKPKSEADSLYEKYGVIAPEEVLEKIWEEIQLPRRATHGSVGYDFFPSLGYPARSSPAGLYSKRHLL